MKRLTRNKRHPDKPFFFWCPSCCSYKHESDFHKDRQKVYGMATYCKECSSQKTRESQKKHPEKPAARSRKYRQTKKGQDSQRKGREKWLAKHPEYAKERDRKGREELYDWYVKKMLIGYFNSDADITDEMIEMKRQHIIALRTMKELKMLIAEYSPRLKGRSRKNPSGDGTLWCPKCEKYKIKSDFSKDSCNKKLGVHGYCRECMKPIKREQYRQRMMGGAK